MSGPVDRVESIPCRSGTVRRYRTGRSRPPSPRWAGPGVGHLTWYYAVLYGATAMATIVAAVATDGVAFVAEVALEVVTFGMLVADCVNAVAACDLIPSAHAAGDR